MAGNQATDRLRSFGRRRTKRLQGKRKECLETALPDFLIPQEGERSWDLRALFPAPPATLCMEIGFGGGEHLAAQAMAHPEAGYIGCEPFLDGVAKLLAIIQQQQLTNIRLWPEDVRLLLERLPDATLDKVFILFPDPWPKLRHHKRRLINAALLDMLARTLKPGGELLLATDHAGYAEWMLQHMLVDERFFWTAREPEDFTRPPEGWVETRYQQKAQKEGRAACFLLFKKQ